MDWVQNIEALYAGQRHATLLVRKSSRLVISKTFTVYLKPAVEKLLIIITFFHFLVSSVCIIIALLKSE